MSFESAQQFGAFFHYSKISGKIGVKNVFKAYSAQSSHHFAGYQGAGRQPEFFAESSPDRGCRLNNYGFALVHQSQ